MNWINQHGSPWQTCLIFIKSDDHASSSDDNMLSSRYFVR